MPRIRRDIKGGALGFLDPSSVTAPFSVHKHTRSKGPFLRRRYLASSVVWASPTPGLAAALSGDVRAAPPPIPSLPHRPRSPSLHAVLTTPCRTRSMDRSGACWLSSGALPRPASSLPVLPSPFLRRGRRPHLHFPGLLKLYSRYGAQAHKGERRCRRGCGTVPSNGRPGSCRAHADSELIHAPL